jgi:hypothetical protein
MISSHVFHHGNFNDYHNNGCVQEDYPLPEDYDLQSFSPLSSSLSQYNYRLVSRNPVTDQVASQYYCKHGIFCPSALQLGLRIRCLFDPVIRDG